MNKLTKILTIAFSLSLFAGTALAKGGTPQNHHCVKDGAPMPDKTKKECKKEGGKWEKDAPAPKAEGEGKADAAKAEAK